MKKTKKETEIKSNITYITLEVFSRCIVWKHAVRFAPFGWSSIVAIHLEVVGCWVEVLFSKSFLLHAALCSSNNCCWLFCYSVVRADNHCWFALVANLHVSSSLLVWVSVILCLFVWGCACMHACWEHAGTLLCLLSASLTPSTE